MGTESKDRGWPRRKKVFPCKSMAGGNGTGCLWTTNNKSPSAATASMLIFGLTAFCAFGIVSADGNNDNHHHSGSTAPSMMLGAPMAPPFDCRQQGQECLHDGICSTDGTRCDCSPSPHHWFGAHCERRRCAQRHNPCLNGAQCEKTEQSFQCHCPVGFAGIYCEQRVPTVCDSVEENPCAHGICHVGSSVQEYQCECHYGWTGPNCTQLDHCRQPQKINCLNGHCVNGPQSGHCECRPGWGGEHCELDVDECQAHGGEGQLCRNGGKCVNLIGSFYCECPPNLVGQFCEHRASADECAPSACLNGGQCRLETMATTANWALDVTNFQWQWHCDCPSGFEGARCERIVDDCALGRMTCVNGGQCVRPWLQETFLDGDVANGTAPIRRQFHPATCNCPPAFSGDFCELDVNECELYAGGALCQNGATCMNRHGTYRCLCVGGFNGTHCEHNIDDCVDNLCYAGSTCVDGISRYTCMCAPDRIGNLCEFPNPCFDNPCAHGQCFADQETGNYTCQCDDGWTGRNCAEDVDECAHPATNRCFNGKCLNTLGGFRCECEVGYTDEYCMTLVKYCDANPCQNGATCLNDLGRYDCVCLPGYTGDHCEVRAYQELNKCYLECQNGGICRDASAQQCECPPPYAGILCEIEKPDPCEQNKCAEGAVCAPNTDYISYTCQCPPYLTGPFCEHQLSPCQGGFNPCVHGICHPLPIQLVSSNSKSGGDFSCECLPGWGGPLCDLDKKQLEEEEEEKKKKNVNTNGCPLAENPCQNGGQCVGGGGASSLSSPLATFFECICPRAFQGPLCEVLRTTEERCGRGCRNGGKCIRSAGENDEGNWLCQCPPGFEGAECESEKNECLKAPCKHKGKCVNLGGTGFRCDCAPGWSEVTCEKDVDDCENIVCLNGGTCVDRVNNYRCECGRGYAGRHCEISVPVDKFNQTDLVDMDSCRRLACDKRAGDAKCDPECNLYACQFDGGDCSTKQANPFERCPQPSYCAHVFADGKCDEVCNNERCLFDGFDCVPRPLAKCPRLAECAMRYANGQCDQQCNMAACGWDGGDCDRESEPDPSEQPQILPGELMLVLAVNATELFRHDLLRQFLLSLSAHLRASLALSMDKDGEAKLFEWRSDTGVGTRIVVPPELNVTALFNVHYGDEGEDGTGKRKRRSADEPEVIVVQGVAVFLRVDVTMCNLLDASNTLMMPSAGSGSSGTQTHHQHHHHPLLGVHAPCFSDMDSVAAYVGVANAKKALPDIGVPILQSEARLSKKPQSISAWVWAVLISLMTSLALGAAVIVKRQRPRPKRHAKTWIPPLAGEHHQQQQSAKYGSSIALNCNANNQQPHPQMGSSIWNHYPVANAGSCASSTIPLMRSHAPSMNSLCSQQPQGNSIQQQQQPQQNTMYGHHQQYPGSTAYMAQQVQAAFQQQFYQQSQHPLPLHHLPPLHQQQQQQQAAFLPHLQHFPHHQQSNQLFFLNSDTHVEEAKPAVALDHQQQQHHPQLMQLNRNNQQQFNHHNQMTNSNLISNNTTQASAASCSRSSSSGIGGSSTEHSPLGGQCAIVSGTVELPTTSRNIIEEEGELAKKRRLLAELREMAALKADGLLGWRGTALEPWMINEPNQRGRTLLHLLFENGQLMATADDEEKLLQNIDLLFKAGVRVDELDKEGTTCLSLAVRNRKLRAVRKLVKDCGAKPDEPDWDDKTPLYHCCANLPTPEDVEIAKFLCSKEVETILLNTVTRWGETPLIRCAALRNPRSLRIAEHLLERVESTQRTEFVSQVAGERTALHMAASVGNVEMIRLLVDTHKASMEATDRDGKTPLFIAVDAAHYDAVEVLLQLGADRNKADNNENKIMDLVMQPGYEAIAELFQRYPEHQQHHHNHQFMTGPIRPLALTNSLHLQQQAASTSSSASGSRQGGARQPQQQLAENGGGGKGRQRTGTKRSAAASGAEKASSSSSASTSATHPVASSSSSSNGSSAAKKAALQPTVSAAVPQTSTVMAAVGTSKCHQQQTAGPTSSSTHQQQHQLLTPPNSDQSTNSTTPSPNNNQPQGALNFLNAGTRQAMETAARMLAANSNAVGCSTSASAYQQQLPPPLFPVPKQQLQASSSHQQPTAVVGGHQQLGLASWMMPGVGPVNNYHHFPSTAVHQQQQQGMGSGQFAAFSARYIPPIANNSHLNGGNTASNGNNGNGNNNIYDLPHQLQPPQQQQRQMPSATPLYASTAAVGTSAMFAATSPFFPGRQQQQNQYYATPHYQQPEFLRSSSNLDMVFPSPQEDKVALEPKYHMGDATAAIDFRFLHSYGQQQQQQHNLSNSLTQLDDISQEELVPHQSITLEGALSNYEVPQNGVGTTAGMLAVQQQPPPIGYSSSRFYPLPEQSSPEN